MQDRRGGWTEGRWGIGAMRRRSGWKERRVDGGVNGKRVDKQMAKGGGQMGAEWMEHGRRDRWTEGPMEGGAD